MAAFRICFFNEIPDSTGHDHHCCQRSIEILEAADEEEAIALAIREFEQLEKIARWDLHARTYECAPHDMGI